MDIQPSATALEYFEELQTCDAGKTIATYGNRVVAMDDIDIVPGLEGLSNLLMGLLVCVAQSFECLTRKHHTPPEGVVRPVPFVYFYLMGVVGLFHEDGEIHTRRTATYDVDLHYMLTTLSIAEQL